MLASGEPSVRMTNCTFESNQAIHGAALYFTQAVNYRISDSIFRYNEA